MKEAHSFSNKQKTIGRHNRGENEAISATLPISQLDEITLQQILSYLRYEFKWASIRIVFLLYLGLCLASGGVVGLLTLPILSRSFFGTWVFWKHMRFFPLLLIQGYRIMGKLIKDSSYKFLFSVPFTSQPLKSPDRNIVKLAPNWVHEENTCHNCVRCCDKISCPLLDKNHGTCISYNSFYWRYFLCGRYPISQQQINYYSCEKWVMKFQNF